MSSMWQGCHSSSLTVIEDRMCQNYIEAKEALESKLPPHNLLYSDFFEFSSKSFLMLNFMEQAILYLLKEQSILY